MDDPHVNPCNAGPAQISSPLAPGSTMASPTAVEFELTPDALAAYSWNKANSSRGMTSVLRLLQMLIALASVILGIVCFLRFELEGDFTFIVLPGSAAVLGFGLSLVFPAFYRFTVKRTARALYGSSATHLSSWRRRVEMSATGLVQRGEFIESRLQWPAIERVGVDQDYVFFDAGLGGEIIVPRRAFTHDTAFQAFLDTARRYQKQARSK